MRYLEFRASIENELRRNPEGLTWNQIKVRLNLPYSVPCYTWLYRLEREIGLTRIKEGRSMIWKLPSQVGEISGTETERSGA